MINTIPSSQLVLGYKELLGIDPPVLRISIVEGFCKRQLILEIAGLNYRLKSKTDLWVNTDPKVQREELYYFLRWR